MSLKAKNQTNDHRRAKWNNIEEYLPGCGFFMRLQSFQEHEMGLTQKAWDRGRELQDWYEHTQGMIGLTDR